MANESFPMLVGDRLDYTEGAYDVAVTRASQGAGMLVRHRLSGRNLVVELLKHSEAAFAVEVSAPYATYREIRPSEASGEVEALQRVSWNPQDVVPPVYLRPMVIATVEQPANIVLNGEHGVHEVWQGVEVEVTPGAILAADQFWRASSTWESLIRLAPCDDLLPSVYRVDDCTSEGFYFKVHLHPALFEKMVNPGDAHNHCDSILTACLSRGLEIVRAEYTENERWRDYPVLNALHDKLKAHELATWEDKHFRPDEVATALKPIVLGPEADG